MNRMIYYLAVRSSVRYSSGGLMVLWMPLPTSSEEYERGLADPSAGRGVGAGNAVRNGRRLIADLTRGMIF